jgi:hypothetical protein
LRLSTTRLSSPVPGSSSKVIPSIFCIVNEIRELGRGLISDVSLLPRLTARAPWKGMAADA